jgi:hypothetical protein
LPVAWVNFLRINSRARTWVRLFVFEKSPENPLHPLAGVDIMNLPDFAKNK